jgi:biopolymer transport protein ExbD
MKKIIPLVLLILVGCSHISPAETVDKDKACGSSSEQRLLQELTQAPPDERAALVESFGKKCPESAFFKAISTQFLWTHIDVVLPKSEPVEVVKPRDIIVNVGVSSLRLSGGPDLTLDKAQWEAELPKLLSEAAAGAEDPGLIIAAQSGVPYRDLVRIIDLARQAGITRVIFSVPASDSEEAPAR